MRLTAPTDFEILQALSDRKRNNASNLSHVLDKNRSYINTRLPVLADYGLVERIGPAPNSGLYVITETGAIVAELEEEYADDDVDFDALVEDRLDEQD